MQGNDHENIFHGEICSSAVRRVLGAARFCTAWSGDRSWTYPGACRRRLALAPGRDQESRDRRPRHLPRVRTGRSDCAAMDRHASGFAVIRGSRPGLPCVGGFAKALDRRLFPCGVRRSGRKPDFPSGQHGPFGPVGRAVLVARTGAHAASKRAADYRDCRGRGAHLDFRAEAARARRRQAATRCV